MTHEELLAKIDWAGSNISGSNTYSALSLAIANSMNALRAVVELHKPDVQGKCNICTWITRGGGVMYEACPTIQAIEKELQ